MEGEFMETVEKFKVGIFETDFAGVVFYGSFFIYFDIGRCAFMRKIGHSFTDLLKKGVDTMVVAAHCDYKAPLHFEEDVEVHTKIGKLGNTSIRFDYEVYRIEDNGEKTLAAVGYTVHVFVNEDKKPTPPPDWLRKDLEAAMKK